MPVAELEDRDVGITTLPAFANFALSTQMGFFALFALKCIDQIEFDDPASNQRLRSERKRMTASGGNETGNEPETGK